MSAIRPVVAQIHNSLTPYRLHYHRRIVREVPEIELWSVFTHGESNSPWAANPPEEIRPVEFGPGEASLKQSHPRNALREWRKGGRIIRWLREHDARAVVLGGYNDPGRLRILRWCHRQGIPLFLFADSNIRGDRARGLKAWSKKKLLGRVFRQCRGFLACGSLGVAYFARYGVPGERIYLTPYEPDYHLLERVDSERNAQIAARFGLKPDRQYLIYSGRLVADKRVDLLVEAFQDLAAEIPTWDLIVAGQGEMEPHLRAAVRPEHADRVIWTGFLDDQSLVTGLYQMARVLVLPSFYEPWAVVIQEACAAGLAIVASDAVGAAADLVRDGVNGRIFPTGDRAALAQALRDVTRNPCPLGAASRTILADWRKVADPIDGLRAALRDAGVLGGESKLSS